MDKKNFKNKEIGLKILIDLLNNEIVTRSNWEQKKETAAWTAIALYIPILGAIINYTKNIDSNHVIIIFIFVTILFILFFVYIQSLYSSIYWCVAESTVLNNYISKLITEKDDRSIEIYQEIMNSENINEKIKDQLKNR